MMCWLIGFASYSHLQGMFSRTIRLLEAGMKPVYIFKKKYIYIYILSFVHKNPLRISCSKNCARADFYSLLMLMCSYVFDGKPPDLKKQELAKRYFMLIFL